MFSLALLSFHEGVSEKLMKKMNKELASYFETTSYQLKQVEVPENFVSNSRETFTIYKIQGIDKGSYWVYLSQAPSKTAVFDYLIVFDNTFTITHTKVLIYREEYGGEIGQKRWLSQFEGKKPGDELKYRSNVDAISGATISAMSMTRAVNQFFNHLDQLKPYKIFDN